MSYYKVGVAVSKKKEGWKLIEIEANRDNPPALQLHEKSDIIACGKQSYCREIAIWKLDSMLWLQNISFYVTEYRHFYFFLKSKISPYENINQEFISGLKNLIANYFPDVETDVFLEENYIVIRMYKYLSTYYDGELEGRVKLFFGIITGLIRNNSFVELVENYDPDTFNTEIMYIVTRMFVEFEKEFEEENFTEMDTDSLFQYTILFGYLRVFKEIAYSLDHIFVVSTGPLTALPLFPPAVSATIPSYIFSWESWRDKFRHIFQEIVENASIELSSGFLAVNPGYRI